MTYWGVLITIFRFPWRLSDRQSRAFRQAGSEPAAAGKPTLSPRRLAGHRKRFGALRLAITGQAAWRLCIHACQRAPRAAGEIVGFRTPEYIAAKLNTPALFAGEPIMLAVAESLSKSADGAAPIAWPAGTIFFKTALKVKDVLRRLNQCPKQ
jgi:hypothetical protein